MGRKSIFERLSGKMNFSSEIVRIDKLLKDNTGVSIKVFLRDLPFYQEPKFTYMGIEEFVDTYAFKTWKGRGTCINCNDMLETLGLRGIFNNLENITENDILNYLEYAANILRLVNSVKLIDEASYAVTNVYNAVLENVNSCLNWLNYETRFITKKDIVLVVEKNAAATSVSEIVDEDLAYSIISYNHFLLKGNIEEKRKILLKLANEIEPRRNKLENINYELTDNIFFMFNNLNIRHNNRIVGDKYYNEYVANMNEEELEGWYDKLYQKILLVYLLVDDEKVKKEVKELRKNVKNGSSKN